ncbi:MAG: RNA methyltransferase [Dysgonamonadaceae bacterium]|nr:RNA methyltransferase [Dysgonamonadaceae bacterium]MDD3357200.1 RNA methyltransferase [Dysgonamonadaceae bacterium]MDD3728671.1 RNA methyltransferase [Dysgonamonadaceae bacterium]MDD4247319.1 RNA methyltransferase [Dysgonamonadaceae bacterium]MDD4606676.1 RNA methyltransferase [Dysgonamonadaceae bacterium]
MSKRRKLKVEELNRIDIQEFKEAEKIGLTVVLDNVRSLNNIGSVFRTSDAFRVNEIILCGISATPPQVEIHKTALGAEDSMKWRYVKNTLDAVNELKSEGYRVFAIEQTENSISLEKVSLEKEKKYAIILGHEVHGVQQAVIDASHGCIEIPQHGTKHSLNVSVAAGIVIWEFFNELELRVKS